MRDSRLASMMRLFIAMPCNFSRTVPKHFTHSNLEKKIFIDSLEKDKDGKRNRR